MLHECLTPEVLSDAQSQAILGPLDNARVVEDNTGQDHPLAPDHRLVCRLLREPRCPRWRNIREGEREREGEGSDLEAFLFLHTVKKKKEGLNHRCSILFNPRFGG